MPLIALFLQDQGEAIAHTMTAQRSNARIEGLKAGTSYVVQVRARTVAGYGRYSSPAHFSTNLQSTQLFNLLHYIGIHCNILDWLVNNHFLSLTLKADPPKSWQEQFPLIVGSITASLVFIIAVVVIAIVCLRSEYNPSRKHSIYDKQVCSIWKHWGKYTQRFQMSALIACPLRDHWALSADCFATCEATEFQISIQKLWIINSFVQNTALLTGNSGIEQLLDLIGIQTWLYVWLTEKDTCRSSSAGIQCVERYNFIHERSSSHCIFVRL